MVAWSFQVTVAEPSPYRALVVWLWPSGLAASKDINAMGLPLAAHQVVVGRHPARLRLLQPRQGGAVPCAAAGAPGGQGLTVEPARQPGKSHVQLRAKRPVGGIRRGERSGDFGPPGADQPEGV